MRDDFEAWKAVAPTPGFAERVVAAASAEPVPTRRGRPTRILAGVLLVAAVAASSVIVGRMRGAEASGDVVASERREVRVDGRAVAVLEPGAHVRWNGADVAQPSGDVFWRVSPGGRFDVKTPGGEVLVKGTCFRVKVLAGAALGAAIVVAVYEGSVVVSHGAKSVSLVAGQTAEATERGVETTSEPASPERPVATSAPAEHAVAALDRARADRMRDDLRRLFAEAGPAWGAPEPSAPSSHAPNHPTMPLVPDGDGGDGVDPSYLQKIVRSDFFPLARQCYDAASARNPALAGTIELKFRILGDPSIGGVVSEATLGDKTTIDDPEMRTCMAESMMSVTFAAPPHGGEVTVVYPIVFSPDEPDGG
jgi:FecR protein